MPIRIVQHKTYFSEQPLFFLCFHSMEKIKIPIILTTILVFCYAIFSGLDVAYSIIATLFIFVNTVFLWMVYKVLKDEEPSSKKFDDYFYEDREDLRRS